MMMAAESKSEGSFKLARKDYSGEVALPYLSTVSSGSQSLLPWVPSITSFSSSAPGERTVNGFLEADQGSFGLKGFLSRDASGVNSTNPDFFHYISSSGGKTGREQPPGSESFQPSFFFRAVRRE
jgi:hypothetical protein